ncbi:MAG: SdpI family protein [Acholeplasmatales bacterium]|nr:SdpI family protein [Acholeplasmatales bacterium]
MDIVFKVLLIAINVIIILYLLFGFVLTIIPLKINFFLGYRSKLSVKNEKNWHYANILSGKIFILIGAILVLAFIPIVLFIHNIGISMLIVFLVLQVLAVVVPLVLVPNKLKKFDAAQSLNVSLEETKNS